MSLREEYFHDKKVNDMKKSIEEKYVEFLDVIKNEKEDDHFYVLEEIAKIYWQKVELEEYEEEVEAEMLALAEAWWLERAINSELSCAREVMATARKKQAEDWLWFLILFIILPETQVRARKAAATQRYHHFYSKKLEEYINDDGSSSTPPATPDI